MCSVKTNQQTLYCPIHGDGGRVAQIISLNKRKPQENQQNNYAIQTLSLISANCHIHHFSISLIPADYSHFTLNLPNLGAMETRGGENWGNRIVNQTKLN